MLASAAGNGHSRPTYSRDLFYAPCPETLGSVYGITAIQHQDFQGHAPMVPNLVL